MHHLCSTILQVLISEVQNRALIIFKYNLHCSLLEYRIVFLILFEEYF